MKDKPKYIAEPVPYKYRTAETPKETWYVHLEGFYFIPVFGSVGTKKHAKEIARIMNRSVGNES